MSRLRWWQQKHKGECEMKDYDYGAKPIRAWGYVGFSFLYAIPVIGWLVWLFNALFAKNRNVKNHARSYFCGFLILVLVAIVAVIAVAALYLLGYLSPELIETLGLPAVA